jgi:hypothetical protein
MTFGYGIDAIDAARKKSGRYKHLLLTSKERYLVESAEFEAALAAPSESYSEKIYEGRRYGVSFRRSDDERRNSLFARELEGTEGVRFKRLCCKV